MEKENMPPDGNDNKSNSDTNNDNNVSCEETGEKIQCVGSVSEKGDKADYVSDKDNAEKEKDDDDDEKPLFEDSFSTPPPEEEPEEEPPQEQQESSHQSLVVSPIKGSNSSNKNESSSSSTLSLSSLELIFPSFVVAGFQRKASSILILKSWIQLSLSLDGRDKITKFLQYSTRFLAFWYLSKGNNPTSSAHGHRFTNLFKSLSKSRKAFRLGLSINELHKITNMGLVDTLCWHLKQYYNKGVVNQKMLKDDENLSSDDVTSFSSLSRSLRTTITRKINSIPDQILSFIPLPSKYTNETSTKVEWWKATSSALKSIGLIGYLLGDNLNFLSSSGALDNYSLSDKDRLSHRKRFQTLIGKRSNQSYFFAAIIGLVTNTYKYYRFLQQQKNTTMLTQGEQQQADDNNNSSDSEEQNGERQIQNTTIQQTTTITKEQQQKQFVLFLALFKSCMDVIVFSNNDGIDLHKKWRGRKNHEGLHCLCGLLSAGTGLYSNFPNDDDKITS